MGWIWWDWSLVLRTHLPSVLWHCWLGHLIRKNLSPMTYNVFSGKLNLTHSTTPTLSVPETCFPHSFLQLPCPYVLWSPLSYAAVQWLSIVVMICQCCCTLVVSVCKQVPCSISWCLYSSIPLSVHYHIVTCICGQLYDFTAPQDCPTVIAYHPTQQAFACGFESGVLRVFNVATTTMLIEHK